MKNIINKFNCKIFNWKNRLKFRQEIKIKKQ